MSKMPEIKLLDIMLDERLTPLIQARHLCLPNVCEVAKLDANDAAKFVRSLSCPVA